jgi:hypothetical protein
MKRYLIFLLFFLISSSAFARVAPPHNISFEDSAIQSYTSEYFLTEKYDRQIPVISEYNPEENLDLFNKNRFGFLRYTKDGTELRCNLFTGLTSYQQKTNEHNFAYYGAETTLNMDNKLLLWSNWWNTHFDEDPKLINDPIKDGWTHYEKMILNFAGKLRYVGKYGHIDVGRGKEQIGSNIGSSIILNDACNDYGYFHYKLKIGKKFNSSITHLSLVSDSLNVDGIYDEKFLAIHKMQWIPNSRFRMFFGQMVVYGNRGIEVNYLFPLPFYMLIEHNLRDRDNVLMFGGLNFEFGKTTLYGNLLIDELKVKEVFGNWWGNKYAVQTGVAHQWYPKLRSVLEFSAVRPWLYTHKYLVNKLSNDGVSLGHEEGSNLIQAAFELNWRVLENFNFDFFTSLTKQGSHANQFYYNYNDIQSQTNDTADWLQGEITDKLKLIPVFTYKYNKMHKIKLGAEFIRINEEFENPSVFINYQFTY